MNLIPLYKAQPPFMPYKGGHGFLGVLMEDIDTGRIQCHLCGRLLKSIGKHLFHKHDMTTDEYRRETGLGKTTPLVCSSTSLALRESGWTELTERDREKKRQLLKDNNRSVHRRGAPAAGRQGKRAIQYDNLFGTCELQAQEYFWKLYKANGDKIPNQDSDQKLKYLVYKRFHSYREALLAWGVSEDDIKEKGYNDDKKRAANRDPEKAHPPTLWGSSERIIKSLRNFVKKEKRSPTFGELGNGRLPTRFSIKKRLGLAYSKQIEEFCKTLG
jgi:hypothetical protein